MVKTQQKNVALFICKSIRWEGAFWSNKKQVALFWAFLGLRLIIECLFSPIDFTSPTKPIKKELVRGHVFSGNSVKVAGNAPF